MSESPPAVETPTYNSRRWLAPLALVGILLLVSYVSQSPPAPDLPVTVRLGPAVTEPQVSVAYNGRYGMFLAPDGSLWRWGTKNRDHPGMSRPPQRVGTNDLWLAVAATSLGGYVAIRADTTLWVGDNPVIYTGPGSRSFNSVTDSVDCISFEPGWKTVASGVDRFYALKTDGTLWSWASEASLLKTPERVGSESNWVAVWAGYFDGFAQRSDGSIWSWGTLNFANSKDETEPGRLGSDTNWVYGFAGGTHFFALKPDGSLWGIGPNFPRDFGNSHEAHDWIDCSVRSQAGAAAAGAQTLIQMRPDGSVWASGTDTDHAMGIRRWGPLPRSQVPMHAPIRVPKIEHCDRIWASGATSLAMTSDGKVWIWGLYGHGIRPQKLRYALEYIGDVLRRLGIRNSLGQVSETPISVSTPTPLFKLETAGGGKWNSSNPGLQ